MPSPNSLLYALALSLLTTTTTTFALPSQHRHDNPHANELTPRGKTHGRRHYTLVDHYNSTNFFSSFDHFTDPDPTHGFVSYLSSDDAAAGGLTSTADSQILMHVDHTNITPQGRPSVRLTSQAAYTHGLFIADIAHMPASTCGTWPAFWMFGPDWPNSGEIDILEGANEQATNSVTLHTGPGCTINTRGSQRSTASLGNDCNALGGSLGCSVRTTSTRAFGSGFNAGGGGVYAMQWEKSGVYVWFFPRGAVPADIAAGRPDTTRWGLPVVAFNAGARCALDDHMRDMSIVFDTTFCGDWAGGVWASGSCAARAGSCEEWVANNPAAFAESFWRVNSVKVYQLGY